MDNPLLREFLAETEDLLEVLFGDLQALRVRHREGRARRELIGRIFRHIHTIKGSSATAELETVSSLAHEFENLLDGVRLGRVSIDTDVLDGFDAAASAISQHLAAIARSETPPETQALIERLRKLAQRGSDASASATASQKTPDALPAEIASSLSKHEAHRLRETLEEGAHLFIVHVNFDLATFDERFRDLSDALVEDGEIISTLPGLAGDSPDQISFRIVYATKASREDLNTRASAFGKISLTELTTTKARESKEDEEGKTQTFSEITQTTSISSLTTHVRVELSALDAIIAGAHEVFVEATNAHSLPQSLKLQPADQALLEERAEAIRVRIAELEGQLIGLRMVSVAQMLERAARAGRISARATGKEVAFEAKGGEVKLDKALADAIADPLLHILRNAVDHGIELPSERKKVGKKGRGLVRLEARGEGHRVVLKVTDDGRGIDPLRITRAAAAQGIIEAGRLLTKEQALRLIFRPGFSTAISVSSISGRGVGLDVVERAVEQVGGELHVSSEAGAGTTFEIVLPTTLALLPSLVVRSSNYLYCIDASRVLETGFMAASDVERNISVGTIDWRGSPIPLLEMRKLLAQSPLDVKEAQASVPVIIVSHVAGRGTTDNGKRAAIIVDALEGQTEALVRGLGRHAARWRGIIGATELRDGTLALVLDLPRLLEVN